LGSSFVASRAGAAVQVLARIHLQAEEDRGSLPEARGERVWTTRWAPVNAFHTGVLAPLRNRHLHPAA
jgi:hypothetical protein